MITPRSLFFYISRFFFECDQGCQFSPFFNKISSLDFSIVYPPGNAGGLNLFPGKHYRDRDQKSYQKNIAAMRSKPTAIFLSLQHTDLIFFHKSVGWHCENADLPAPLLCPPAGLCGVHFWTVAFYHRRTPENQEDKYNLLQAWLTWSLQGDLQGNGRQLLPASPPESGNQL